MANRQTQQSENKPQSTVDTTLSQAVELFKAEKYIEADKLCTTIIQSDPNHIDAINLLGVIAQKVNRHDLAIGLFQRAININNNIAILYFNLGLSLYHINQGEEAAKALDIAHNKDPGNKQISDFLNNITKKHLGNNTDNIPFDRADDILQKGIALHQSGQVDRAIACYQQAIKNQPDNSSALCNLGSALKHQGKIKEAIIAYEKAITIKPDLIEAHNNLGNTMVESGRLDEAAICFDKAISINPEYATAHNNLGKVKQEQNRFAEAQASYQKALTIDPNFAHAYYNMGTLLAKLRKDEDAIASYKKAISINPDFAESHYNIGSCLYKQSKLHEAVYHFKKAISINPDYIEAHSNLIFCLDYIPDSDSELPKIQRKKWAKQHTEHLQSSWLPFKNSPERKRKLRIGYVAAEFWKHPNAEVFGPLLLNHDAENFEICCYAASDNEDELTAKFKKISTLWTKTDGLDDETLATKIRQDGIDILVDLSGHSPFNRLMTFARKPAPIQIHAFGYPLGTNMKAMDYIFLDPVLIPENDRSKFTEEIIDLSCVIHMNSDTLFPALKDPPVMENGYITFGAFNRLEKYTDTTYSLWAKILHKISTAKLLMKTEKLSNQNQQTKIYSKFEKLGIPADRLILLGKTSKYEHLQANGDIDIMLDSFPLNGGITTLASLRMGVPVLTCEKLTRFLFTSSVLNVLKLDEWRAKDEDEYVNLAVRFSKNIPYLKELRYDLRSRFDKSVLGDSKLYTQEVESVYRKLWIKWCDNQ
ncbi:MAG: tetratricopeptide repeat protein [Magnetococcales bacterium]|nr:tetratricopeptide repeat protein [Magnetococcales bacterium]